MSFITLVLIDSPDCYGGLEAVRPAGSAVLASTLSGRPVLAAGSLARFRTVPGYILHERVLLETVARYQRALMLEDTAGWSVRAKWRTGEKLFIVCGQKDNWRQTGRRVPKAILSTNLPESACSGKLWAIRSERVPMGYCNKRATDSAGVIRERRLRCLSFFMVRGQRTIRSSCRWTPEKSNLLRE